MFAEVFDYWLIKLFPPPLSYIGLWVVKEAKNYTRLSETPWKYVWTTLDFAYLEERRAKVVIEKNDPFFIYGDFGGTFAVYGDCTLEERKITKYWGFKLDENGKLTHDVDKVFNDGACLMPKRGRSTVRRLKLSERKYLNEQKAATDRNRSEEKKNK